MLTAEGRLPRELRAEVSWAEGKGETVHSEMTADSSRDEKRFKSLTARLSRADGDGGGMWPALQQD